jgi:predicted dehydrogenase
MRTLKAAVIGSGLIAGLKHVPAFQKHQGRVRLTALCDLNVEAARKLAAQHGIPEVYGDISEMLAKVQPDVVDICTPPKTHAKIAIQCMQAGSHVLIEKPMAQTLAECDAIMATSRENNVKVCLAHSDLFYYRSSRRGRW